MFNSLLYIGLFVTSFAFFPGAEIRELKMTMALVFASALCMAEIYSKGLKPGKNIWVFLLLAYLPIAVMLAPSPVIDLMGINVAGFWAWKPMFKMLLFGLLFIVMSNHDFSNVSLFYLLKIMLWCGFLTSIYEITQFFYADQFFVQCADGNWGRVAGFIGNPTLTAPFVAMLVPIALYLRKYWMLGVMIVGAAIPDSQMAWFALAAGLAVYYALKGPRWFVTMAGIVLLALGAFFLFFSSGQHISNLTLRSIFEDHERLLQWKQILKDWKGPLAPDQGMMNNFFLTGRGIGSFQFVYHVQHINLGTPNRFHQAHNDYLEFAYSAGFIGIGLFLTAICSMIKRNVSMQAVFTFGESRYNRALLACIATISVSAFGTFVWQIGTTAFFSVIIAGLLHNDSVITREYFQ